MLDRWSSRPTPCTSYLHCASRRCVGKVGLTQPPIIVAISIAILGLAPAAAEAACDCDHVIAVDQVSLDGDALGVKPGQSVCLAPGQRAALRLSNFHGTEGAPIGIRNCDGVAHIENQDRGYGVTIDTSEQLQITGTGDASASYGIYVRAAKVAAGPGDYSAMGVAPARRRAVLP